MSEKELLRDDGAWRDRKCPDLCIAGNYIFTYYEAGKEFADVGKVSLPH